MSKSIGTIKAALGLESKLTLAGIVMKDSKKQWQPPVVLCPILSDATVSTYYDLGTSASTLLEIPFNFFLIITATISLDGSIDIKAAVSECTASDRPMLAVAGAVIGMSGPKNTSFLHLSLCVGELAAGSVTL